MSKYKPHRSITVTAELLRELGACRAGVSKAKRAKLLPMRISTDAEKNLKDPEALRKIHGFDLAWVLFGATRAEYDGFDDQAYSEARNDSRYSGTEPFGKAKGIEIGVVAQGLAILADRLLSAKGK